MSCFYPRSSATSSQGLSAPNRNTKRPWGWVWVIMDLEAPSTCIRIFLKMEPFFSVLGRPPFSPFSVECVSWLIGSVGQIEQKKSLKVTEGGLVPQYYCGVVWKKQDMKPNQYGAKIKLVDAIVKLRQHGKRDQPLKLPCAIPASLAFQQLQLYSFFCRLKELFRVKNGLTSSFFFFLKVPKIGVGRMTLKVEIKEDGPSRSLLSTDFWGIKTFPAVEIFWKPRLHVYVWTDGNGAFQIRWCHTSYSVLFVLGLGIVRDAIVFLSF